MKFSRVITYVLMACMMATNLSFADDTLFDSKGNTADKVISTDMDDPNYLFGNENGETPPLENPTGDANPVVPETPKEQPKIAKEDAKTIRLILGSKKATVNGKSVNLTVPAQSIDGRAYLPMRFLAENILGASPVFDSKTGQITVKSNGKVVKVKLNSKQATIDGTKSTLDAPPVTKNNTTLLPVKFFAKAFGMTISYNSAKKEVVVKEKPVDKNPPVADFEFGAPSFIQGEKILYTDKSSDPDGDKIVGAEFAVSSNPNVKKSDINKLFAKLPSGDYNVMYRVKNDKGLWSQWITKPLTYIMNMPPTLSDVKVTKTDLGRGEEFDIVYTQNNEPWEQIVETLWTYRHENQDPSKAVKKKPLKFFSEGNYIVTLQIKDAYGNLSEVSELKIPVGSRVVQTQFEHLSNGGGHVNSTLENFNGANYLEIFKNLGDLKYQDTPGLLIMSDSPENVTNYGILYQDIVTAQKGRLLTYHVNKIPYPKSSGARIVVIAENIDISPVTFSLQKTGMKGPSPDPHEVGGKVLDAHFLSQAPWASKTIGVGKSEIIYDTKGSINWKPNNLISMLSEFETSGTIRLTVAAFGPTTQLEHLSLLEKLPRDQHPRGTFGVVERSTTIDVPGREATSILLGTGENEWIQGTDGITGETTFNKGNYGVEYKITVNPVEDTLIFVNCRGGAFRGFIGWPDGINRTISSFGPHDARYVGRIPGGQSTTIRYMLANGSAAPVKMGFVPQSIWKN